MKPNQIGHQFPEALSLANLTRRTAVEEIVDTIEAQWGEGGLEALLVQAANVHAYVSYARHTAHVLRAIAERLERG